MNKLIIFLFLLPFVSESSPLSDFSILAKKTNKIKIFDLKKRFFDENGPNTRVLLESEYIEKGAYYEKHPKEFTDEILFNKIGIDDSQNDFSDLKSNYYFKFVIPNFFFEDYENYKELGSWIIDDIPEAYLFKRIDRSEKHLTKLWDFFAKNFIKTISPSVPENSTSGKIIDALIRTYNCIINQDKYKNKMDQIIINLENESPQTDDMIDYMTPILCDDIVNEFERKSEWHQWLDVQWLHSFWVRRYKEGNMEITFTILKAIGAG